jgi:hypothetical protein
MIGGGDTVAGSVKHQLRVLEAIIGAATIGVGGLTLMAFRQSAQLMLADRAGKPRLRLTVDSLGVAKVEFLNDSGRVTARLP